MDKQSTAIIDGIKRNIKIRRCVITFCVLMLISGVVAFFFYGVDSKNDIIKFISSGKDKTKIEKVMTNPRITYQSGEDKFYNIKADKAVHIDKNNIELFDVVASGDTGEITAGRLLVTNNGNNLHFSDHPVLTIIQTKNEQ